MQRTSISPLKKRESRMLVEDEIVSARAAVAEGLLGQFSPVFSRRWHGGVRLGQRPNAPGTVRFGRESIPKNVLRLERAEVNDVPWGLKRADETARLNREHSGLGGIIAQTVQRAGAAG